MFTHKPIDIPELETKTVDRKRFYLTPEGKMYPSITTVLQKSKMQGLMEWRKRVGEDVANYIARTAAQRGTKVHHMCEDLINNKEVKREPFLAAALFSQLEKVIKEKVNNVYAQECGLYSDKYMVAGRVDCIAEYDGVLSIIDFKTSRSERNDDWNESYYIQASAYAEMFEERTGIPISNIVIIMAVEGNEAQLFQTKRDNYIEQFKELRKRYENENTK